MPCEIHAATFRGQKTAKPTREAIANQESESIVLCCLLCPFLRKKIQSFAFFGLSVLKE